MHIRKFFWKRSKGVFLEGSQKNGRNLSSLDFSYSGMVSIEEKRSYSVVALIETDGFYSERRGNVWRDIERRICL